MIAPLRTFMRRLVRRDLAAERRAQRIAIRKEIEALRAIRRMNR